MMHEEWHIDALSYYVVSYYGGFMTVQERAALCRWQMEYKDPGEWRQALDRMVALTSDPKACSSFVDAVDDPGTLKLLADGIEAFYRRTHDRILK